MEVSEEEYGIAVRHKLVALLGGSIQAHRVVHPVLHAEGDLLVTAIHTA